jgi:hypothetical protein
MGSMPAGMAGGAGAGVEMEEMVTWARESGRGGRRVAVREAVRPDWAEEHGSS